jgi:hypothetical protein
VVRNKVASDAPGIHSWLSARLQLGQGAPAPPQSLACGPTTASEKLAHFTVRLFDMLPS